MSTQPPSGPSSLPSKIRFRDLYWVEQLLWCLGTAIVSLLGFGLAVVGYLFLSGLGLYPTGSDGSGFVVIALLLLAIYPLTRVVNSWVRRRTLQRIS